MNSDKFFFLRLIGLAMLAILFSAAGASGENTSVSTENAFKPASFEGSVMKRVEVIITGCPWCTPAIEQMARDLIALHQNERFTAGKYDESIESLTLSGSFEEILPSIKTLDEGIEVIFVLKPARVISDIKVSGEYPLFKSEVLKAMSIYPGDTLLPGALTAHEARLGDLYSLEGYIEPRVKIEEVRDSSAGTSLVNVQIQPGDYYVLDQFTIDGNRGMSASEIRMHMNIWRTSFLILESRRFKEPEFDRDVKNLTKLYWKRRYPECEIRSTVSKDPGKALVSVGLSIKEGPRYEVSFSGNHRFWSSTLKKDLVIFKEGNRRDRGLRKSIENIKQRYRMAGYSFTEVKIKDEKITANNLTTRRIELTITEGPHTSVKSMKFTGNSAFDEESLKKTMKTGTGSLSREDDYIPDQLEMDISAIKNRYLQSGYQDVKITPDIVWNKDRTAVEITMKIDEGVKSIVKSLTFTGLTAMSREKALESLRLKAGQPFSNALVKKDEVSLANLISASGHPYVTVKSSAGFTPDKSEVDVSFSVNEGPLVRIGNIYYKGNLKTRRKVLDREIKIRTGDDFSLAAILEGQKNIRDMGIFKSVQFKTPGLKDKEENIPLLVDVEETPPYYIQGGVGYRSDNGFYGNARAGDRNLFGMNYDSWASGEISQVGYKGEVALNQRNLFGTNISTTYSISYERKEDFNQTFGIKDLTGSINFQRKFTPEHLTASLGLRYERREQFPQDSSIVTDDTYLPRGILVTTPGLAYDTRDSFVRPSKGIYSSLYIDVSRGLENSLDNFLKYKFLLRGYWRPLPRLTFAGMGGVGFIDPYDTSSSIPVDQLFYLGGTFSVRGYAENMLRYDSQDNAVGGRLSVNASLEARIELINSLEATLFYDTGSIQKPVTEAGTDSFRSSVGFGLSYITPIGPISLLYGLKIHPREDESPGCFHFSIGYTF
ncbi:MAG TPA: outer membrane protein assembly factor BamA [Desulfomonilia bacterium]